MLVIRAKANPLIKDPTKWAALAAEEKGFTHALGVANACKHQTLGKESDAPNPHASYWLNAYNWLMNRCPAQELEAWNNRQKKIEAQNG